MTAPASHTYLKTRASIMAKRLFTTEQLEALLETPLEQMVQRFNLAGILENATSEAQLNRAAERALIHTLMLELGVLLRPLDGFARDILIHWTRKFELYNLKALIRGKLQGLPFEQINHNLYELPQLISLPHDRLLRTESVLELLRSLERTHYADIARQARQVFEEKNEPFSLDAAIDRSYYTGLLRRINRGEAQDQRELEQLVASLIDQQNLIWLLRYRFSYALSPTETYYLMIPFGRQLHQERLKSLVNIDQFGALIEALPGRLKTRLEGADNMLDAERLLDQETADQARRALRFSVSAVTRSLAYLVLREMDLKRLYALVQGKALNLSESLLRIAANLDGVKQRHGSSHV
ncbi:MAG: V-type ATPase subunit [Gammaproteobacteria bacterium]|nr:V-type ATPase subunit [Gammaproteobacteria bacterium]